MGEREWEVSHGGACLPAKPSGGAAGRRGLRVSVEIREEDVLAEHASVGGAAQD